MQPKKTVVQRRLMEKVTVSQNRSRYTGNKKCSSVRKISQKWGMFANPAARQYTDSAKLARKLG